MFVPEDGGARRNVLFAKQERATTPESLARQLAASSLYYKDDPEHYAMKRAAGFTNISEPERRDPPLSA